MEWVGLVYLQGAVGAGAQSQGRQRAEDQAGGASDVEPVDRDRGARAGRTSRSVRQATAMIAMNGLLECANMGARASGS